MSCNVLIVPIEELKPLGREKIVYRDRSFDRTYWGIETGQKWHHSDKLSPAFWSYLLRNWNLAWSSRSMVSPSCFDRTYWGIETFVYNRKLNQARLQVLIVPIEELKLGNGKCLPFLKRAQVLIVPIEELKPIFRHCPFLPSFRFDRTYWGIETWKSHITSIPRSRFDRTYWGIETYKKASLIWRWIWVLIVPIEELKLRLHESAKGIFELVLIVPIEELKPASRYRQAAGFGPFWSYLLRNWNRSYTMLSA